MEVNPQLSPPPASPPRLDPETSRVDLPWPTTSKVATVPVLTALGVPSLPPPSLPLIQVALDAEQGALVVADPLLPIIPDFYVKTKYSSYA
jgi:hypothetical protein